MAAPAPGALRNVASHSHGSGYLSLVTDANRLQVDIPLPLADLVGFEHKPQTIQEKAKLEAALAEASFRDVVAFNPEAQCELSTVHVHSAHSDEQDPQAPSDAHAEATVGLSFVCKDSAKLTSLETKLFDKARALKNLKVEYVVQQNHGSKVLSPNEASLRIEHQNRDRRG